MGCFVALLNFAPPAGAGDIVTSGTGMALAAIEKIGNALAVDHPEIKINVLPSMGSSGGIKALQDHVLDVSLSARRLKASETESGVIEIACFDTALVFATQPPLATNFARDALPAIYGNADPRWPDDTPLKVILRAESGSEQPYLARQVPGLGAAFDLARQRAEVPIGMTDQLNLDLAERMHGAFAIASLLQLIAEDRRLDPVAIDGVTPSAATVKDGRYPFAMKVCLLALKNKLSDDVVTLADFIKSPTGTKLLAALGATPVN